MFLIDDAKYRPAKSSDKAEGRSFLVFFENLPPFRFILKFFRFFRTLLVIANTIHRHIEVLLFSISFVFSALFGDVETEKNRLTLCQRQIKISLYVQSKKSSAFFCQKEEDLHFYFIKCWKVCEWYILVVGINTTHLFLAPVS